MTASSTIRGGIIAAGEGARLRADGYRMSKPMVPVGGRPLIELTLDRFRIAGIRHLTVIINEASTDVGDWLRAHATDLDLDLIVRTTPSSYASFKIVAERLAGSPAVITTTDSVMPAEDFCTFVRSAASLAPNAVALGLTDHVDDEKPLWATLDARGEIRRLGGTHGTHVTAGVYWLPARRLPEASESFARLRDYLGWLGAEHPPVYGIVLPRVFDIDRARDIAAAEAAWSRSRSLRGRMSAARTCWGIYREAAHSPGRVDDDHAILDCVGEVLRERGFDVVLVSPDADFPTNFANIFAMCERGPVLDRLKKAEATGSIVVNSPEAIRNTYRHRMIELFARHSVPSPPSQIVASDANSPRPQKSVWIKRYDFHATEAQDVMYAASEDGWREALHAFARRGIPFVIAQEHVPGDLIKFYGVSNASLPVDSCWFEWFYHRDKGMLGHSFESSKLRRAAFDAAAALGLEVFGGDAIIQANGEPVIIDMNAWPSYARFREGAARAIADHLTERFQRRPRVVAATGG